MSLRHNVIANYVGQGYSALIAVLIYPLFLQFLGEESYGLLGFFMTLQAWLILFDIGVTPALSREAANARTGYNQLGHFYNLLRSVETLFIVLSLLTFSIGLIFVEWIHYSWLNIQSLPAEYVELALSLMFFVISLQWFITLYRSVLNGLELQVWLNKLTVFTSTIRYPLSLCLMYFFDYGLLSFVFVQLLCSFFELFCIAFKVSEYKSQNIPEHKSVFDKMALRSIAPFALKIGLSTGVWLFVSQFDRLILSNVLPIGEYGYFTLLMIVVSGITRLTSPVSIALLPRFSTLVAENNLVGFVNLYRKSTRLMVAFITFIVLFLVFWQNQILILWTRSSDLVVWSENVLTPYLLGTGIMGVLAFQYYLQYAFGNLKYHVYLNISLFFLCVPGVILTANFYGAVGTGYFWLLVQLLLFLLWPFIIHEKFIKGLHFKWFFLDVIPLTILISMVSLISYALFCYQTFFNGFFLISTAFVFTSLCCFSAYRFFNVFFVRMDLNDFRH